MSTNKPHIHAELIKAWADGAIIERAVYGALSGELLRWEEQKHPYWVEDATYRVKPEPKEDIVMYYPVSPEFGYLDLKDLSNWLTDFSDVPTYIIKTTFDGENPSVLKSIERVD